ncbi:hypothetical protein B0H19DRAFT_1154237 [Mycena capillaripes]|nr:hypothetical protein B0H19DRAFT_1154237 [Mycena capillaripes]
MLISLLWFSQASILSSYLYCRENVQITYEAASNDPRLTNLVLKPRKDESTSDFPKLNVQVCDSCFTCNSPIPLH